MTIFGKLERYIIDLNNISIEKICCCVCMLPLSLQHRKSLLLTLKWYLWKKEINSSQRSSDSRQPKQSDSRPERSYGITGPVVLEKLAHFDREVIPERRMHAKGSGAYGTFTVTHDITKYTRAAIFSEVGKKQNVSSVSQQWQAKEVQQTPNAIFAGLP